MKYKLLFAILGGMLLGVLLLGLPSEPARAQLDVMHYIPPLFGADNVTTHRLYLSTPSTTTVNVNVEFGDGTTVWNGQITNAAPATVTGIDNHVLTNPAQFNQISNAGLIVTADAPIYANIRHRSDPQGGSLTAKGLAALGTRFRAGIMRDNSAVESYRAHFISVMATEDDTTVNFDDIKPGLVFHNTPASGSPPTSDPITVTLNTNQSYVIGVRADLYTGTAEFNDINGTLVTSDKPIVVNSGTWLGGPDPDLGARDIGIDQIVPESRLALQYILMKGDGENTLMETPIVVAIADDTDIFVNGEITPTNPSPLMAGDYYFLYGLYSAQGNMLVETNRPVYIYQTLAGSTSYATPGMSFIPPVDVTSPNFVDNIPDVDFLGNTTINILARADAWVEINGSSIGVPADPVSGTLDWVTYRVPGLTGDIGVESDQAIAVQFTNLDGSLGAAGYYAGLPLVYRDYGDLPVSYDLTVVEDNGARHVSSALLLGATVDGETDGQESADAGRSGVDGDDGNDDDDEDGVLVPGAWAEGGQGGVVDVTVTGGIGCLSAWIDWDNNADFADGGDQILSMVEVSAGVNPIRFDVPVGALTVPGNYDRFARFRLAPDSGTPGDCSDDSAIELVGLISGGEVEDHYLNFDLTDAPVADAGPDQGVFSSDLVTLDGSDSYDPNNDLPLSYAWTQVGGPGVVLSSPTISQPTFTAPDLTAVLTFSLVVTDSLGAPDLTPDEVVITVSESPTEALDLSKTAEDLNGPPLYPGDEILYTILVTNTWSIEQTNVVVTDAIPAGTTYVPGSAWSSQGSVSGPDPLVADIGTLAAGDMVTFTFHVTVDLDAVGATIENYADADSDQQAPPAQVGPITPPGGGLVEPIPDALDMNKTAEDLNGAPLYPGDEIAYTVVVTNLLGIDQTGVVVTDAIPAGATYVPGSAQVSQGGVSGPDPLVADFGTLTAGGVVTLTFNVWVSGPANQEIENYAQGTSDQQGPPIQVGPVIPPGGGTIVPNPDALEMSKTAEDLNGEPLYPGETILYTVMVTNLLGIDQTNVVVTDAIPAFTTYVPGSAAVSQGSVSGPDPLVADFGTLVAGTMATVTFRVTVDTDAVSQTIENYAQASSDQQGPPIEVGPITPPGGGVVQPIPQALALSKTAEDLNGEPLYPGDEIRYSLVVTNLLDFDQDNVVITDAIPSGAMYVPGSAAVSQGSFSGPDPLVADIGTLAANGTATFTFNVWVTGPAGDRLANYAYAGSEYQVPPTPIGPITPPGGGVIVPDPNALSLSKTAQDLNGEPLYPGDTILYTVSVENLLAIDQTGVVITDAIPHYTTYVSGTASVSQGTVSGPDPLVANVGSLAAGETATLTFQVMVDMDAKGQTIENYASAGSEQQGPPVEVGPITPPGGGLVLPTPDALALAKTAEDVNGAPLYPGDEILYTITVQNMLDTDHTGVVITDAIPADTTYVPGSAQVSQGSFSGPDPLVADVGTLAAGQIATMTFRVTVNQDAAGMVIENYAQARGDEQEEPIEVGPITPGPGGTVVIPGLALAKTAEDLSGTPLYPGDEIRYTITVTNLMSSDHAGVIITDAIPDFTTYVAGSAQVSQGTVSSPDPLVADIGTLAANGTATFTFRVVVVSGATGQTIMNSAQAGGEQQTPPVEVGPITPPDGGVVQPPPGTVLLLQKTAQDLDGAPLYPGDTILYTVSVENLLDTDQTGVVITDTIPHYTTYVSGTASVTQGGVSGPDPLVADIGTLAANDIATLTFQATVDQGSEGQEVENYAFAASDEQDPPVEVGPITPPGGGTVEPLPTADLAVDKAYIRGITTITYTITATNLGPDAADGALLYDEIADFITNVTWTCQASGGAVCTPNGFGNLIEETITTFPSGGMLVFTVMGDIPLFGGEDNAVTISVPEGIIDPDLSNNTATIGKPFKILLPVIGKNPEGF